MKFLDTIKQVTSRSTIIVFNQLSLIIVIPILASRLSLEQFGQVAIAMTIAQLIWVISDWGIQNYSIEIWKNFKNINQKNNFISSFLFLSLAISVLFLCVIFILINTGILRFSLLFFIFNIPSVIFGSLLPIWLFQVMKKSDELILPTLISRILYLLLVIILINNDDSAHWVLLIQGMMLGMITFYSFFRMYTKYSFRICSIKFNEVIKLFKIGKKYLLNLILNSQINTIWAFGLSIVGGPVVMSVYTIGDQLYRAGSAFTNVIAQIIRINYIKESLNEIQPIIIFFSTFYLLISLLIFIFAEPVIFYFFSEFYADSIKIVQFIMVIWSIQSIIKLINYPILSQKYGTDWVNSKTNFFILFHFLMFCIWVLFFSSSLQMIIFFGLSVFTHLFYFVYSIFLFRNKNK
jgi:PST family polysaccharide transporter